MMGEGQAVFVIYLKAEFICCKTDLINHLAPEEIETISFFLR